MIETGFLLYSELLFQNLCVSWFGKLFFSKDCPWTHWLLENLILLKLALNSFDLINMMVGERYLFFQFYALFCHHQKLRCCVNGTLFWQVYSTSMAMLLTMVLSIYLFSVKATIQVLLMYSSFAVGFWSLLFTIFSTNTFFNTILMQLFLGIIICIISLQMYFMPVHMLVELPQTLPVTSK